MLASTEAHAAAPLGTLAEIRALPKEVAGSALQVRIEALVLYANSSENELIVNDGTASCYTGVDLSGVAAANRPKAGDRVLLEGFTQTGGFLPHFHSQSWKIIGQGEMPTPHPISADEIYLPRFDSAWVEVPAVVTGVETGGIAYTLVVEVFGQTFKADIPNCPDAAARAASLMQRPTCLRAVLGTVLNPMDSSPAAISWFPRSTTSGRPHLRQTQRARRRSPYWNCSKPTPARRIWCVWKA